jgi:hypothetical protein
MAPGWPGCQQQPQLPQNHPSLRDGPLGPSGEFRQPQAKHSSVHAGSCRCKLWTSAHADRKSTATAAGMGPMIIATGATRHRRG